MIFKNLRKKSAKQTVRRSVTANYTHGKNKEIDLKGSHKENQGGVALIIVLGVLSLLAVLGTAFTIEMRLEQKAAVNYTEGVRARYLAKAGVEAAIAALRKYASEFAAYVPVGSWDSGWRTTYNIPDFSAAVSLGAGTYTVNIIDCASQIYVNANNAKRLLNNLGSVLGLVGNPGTDIDNAKPTGGYTTKKGIKALSASDYTAMKDYMTVYGWDDPNTAKPATLDNEPRSMINVNTADKEVLCAILNGISNGADTVQVVSLPIADNLEETEKIADFIINNATYSRPYTTWTQFHGAMYQACRVDALASATDLYIIEANCNPNTNLMNFSTYSFCPNKILGDLRYDDNLTLDFVDKADLGVTYTTELGFNSNGYFELESTGTVTDSGGRIISKTIKAVVKIFDTWRQTTQSDFSLSGAGSRVNVELYPVPTVISAATYDGQVMLETVKNIGVYKVRGNFNSGLDFNQADGVTAEQDGSAVVQSILSGGDLFTDGAFVRDQTLKYQATNNIESAEGTIAMWVKSAYDGTAPYYFFNMNNGGTDDDVSIYDDGSNLHFLIYANTYDTTLKAFHVSRSSNFNPGEWHHIAATWEDDIGGDEGEVEIFVDGMRSVVTPVGATFNFSPLPTYMYIGSNTNSNNKATSIIDELVIAATRLYTGGHFDILDRYYDPPVFGDATFESSTLNLGSTVEWGTFTWTEYIPDGISGNITVNIDTDGGFDDGTSDNPAGANAITGAASSAVKYQVVFEADGTTTPKGTGTSLRETPVLDDVTITYLSPVQILSWEEITDK